MATSAPLSYAQVRRIFWRTRSRLLEHGLLWENVRGMTPAEAAKLWVHIRREAKA